MERFVEGECGRPNPLVKLSKQIKAGNSYQNDFNGHVSQRTQSNENVMSIPTQQTFDMQSLLNQIQETEQPLGRTLQEQYSVPCVASREWQEEFTNFHHMEKSQSSNRSLELRSSETSYHFPMFQPSMFLSNKRRLDMSHQMRLMSQHGEWSHGYIDESISTSSDMQLTAQEILQSMEDKIVDEAEAKLVEKLDKKTQNSIANAQDVAQKDDSEAWVKEYNEVGDEDYGHEELIQNDIEYWDKLQKDWNELFRQEQFLNDEEFATNFVSGYKEKYEFEESNPFVDMSNAFEEGLEKLKKGDLISAILLFEEAVRVQPDHAEAWQYLGTSQAENEQETLAIAALNKCLELQPDNLTSRMAVAVCYTNESLQVQACRSLKSWIAHHPRYSHLIDSAAPKTLENDYYSFMQTSSMSSGLFKEVENLYLAAARLSPQRDIDAEIQVGLGVLYNLSGDYEKATDCFKAGLGATPDSADIWNKFGATLANSGKSAEAIEAYKNALQLRPGFIRCRYNIGISCINMKAYNEAAQHFLIALNMQRQGEDPSRAVSTMSENIWSTLRMTLSMLGRLDLMKAVERKNLKLLNDEFDVKNS